MQGREIRLSRAEYWILESAVEHAVPMCWLASKNLGALLNKRTGHGLERPALVDTVEYLIGRGWIGVDRWSGESFEGTHTGALERAEIETALDELRLENPLTQYGLTAEGGRIWESFAQPNWDAYLEVFSNYRPNGRRERGVATSATLWRVEKFLKNAHYMGHFFDPERVRLRVLRPWQATYWKILPEGHRAVYRYPIIPYFYHHNILGYQDSSEYFSQLVGNRDWYNWM
jgi:hypothetical protein